MVTICLPPADCTASPPLLPPADCTASPPSPRPCCPQLTVLPSPPRPCCPQLTVRRESSSGGHKFKVIGVATMHNMQAANKL